MIKGNFPIIIIITAKQNIICICPKFDSLAKLEVISRPNYCFNKQECYFPCNLKEPHVIAVILLCR